MHDLNPANPLFLKLGLQKLEEMFDLQFYKFIQTTLAGFDINHSSFTPVNLIYSHCLKISKRLHFVMKGIGQGLARSPSCI